MNVNKANEGMNDSNIAHSSITPPSATGELLVILSHAPHGSSLLREGLDMALVAAAFGRRVSLLFMGQGSWALQPGQGEGALGQKGTQSTLEMLEMYDIDNIMVEAESLELLGLESSDLVLSVSVVDAASVQQAIASHTLVMNF